MTNFPAKVAHILGDFFVSFKKILFKDKLQRLLLGNLWQHLGAFYSSICSHCYRKHLCYFLFPYLFTVLQEKFGLLFTLAIMLFTKFSYRMSTGGRLIKFVIIFFLSDAGGVNFLTSFTESSRRCIVSLASLLTSSLFAATFCCESSIVKCTSCLSLTSSASTLCREADDDAGLKERAPENYVRMERVRIDTN